MNTTFTYINFDDILFSRTCAKLEVLAFMRPSKGRFSPWLQVATGLRAKSVLHHVMRLLRNLTASPPLVKFGPGTVCILIVDSLQ